MLLTKKCMIKVLGIDYKLLTTALNTCVGYKQYNCWLHYTCIVYTNITLYYKSQDLKVVLCSLVLRTTYSWLEVLGL